jgi:hypothetical protein
VAYKLSTPRSNEFESRDTNGSSEDAMETWTPSELSSIMVTSSSDIFCSSDRSSSEELMHSMNAISGSREWEVTRPEFTCALGTKTLSSTESGKTISGT